MNGEHLLGIYSGIAELTRQMLAAARTAEWDALIALETTCGEEYARLKAAEDGFKRDAQYQRAKAALIQSALENDAQIRLLVSPWQAQLLAMIGHSGQHRRLEETYAVPA